MFLVCLMRRVGSSRRILLLYLVCLTKFVCWDDFRLSPLPQKKPNPRAQNFAVVASLFSEICLLQRASFCRQILSLIVLSFSYLISFSNGEFVSPNFVVVVRLNKLVCCDAWVRLAEICFSHNFVLPIL